MVNVISLKCPECGANISVEAGRKECFCTYCAAKIIIDDGSTTHTYRKVDEARIKEAEVSEKIRLKELLLEETRLAMEKEKEAKKERKRAFQLKCYFITIVVSLLMMLVGFFLDNVLNLGVGSGLLIIGLYALVFAVILIVGLFTTENEKE